MKFATKLLSGAALAVALMNTASANTYNIVDTSGIYTFDITLTTAADATSTAQAITAVSGTFNGVSVKGLDMGIMDMLGTPSFLAVQSPTSWFTKSLFLSLSNGKGAAFYTSGTVLFTGTPLAPPPGDYTQATLIDLNPPTATAVPEPEAYAMMLAGLGLVGFAARRKLAA